MNQDMLKGEWKQLKGKVKEKWGQLTDDDMTQVEGRRDTLIGRIQERYGVAKDEAQRQVDDFERGTRH
jgi:uncharacterized protein YjbJ (UPF0337 family)